MYPRGHNPHHSACPKKSQSHAPQKIRSGRLYRKTAQYGCDSPWTVSCGELSGGHLHDLGPLLLGTSIHLCCPLPGWHDYATLLQQYE